ncbi:secreted RxLR effector protein 161-like [Drosophila elegans]|uniref:secreted RxLR effector protein 161-like n=1 Tax=Drosophila elegans TaxID=30023 RepID=UPI001BC85CA2|nr:secreted RxLR effector protein 161-like [Drosophila elegans]
MENCKPVNTPINTNEKLSTEMCPKTENEKEEVSSVPYQSLIGALMWLAVSTRPDIAFAVSALSQYNTNFGKQHWIAAKRVLRYLKGTQDYCLVYKRSGKDLVGYADADWAANIDDRRSFSGFAFKFAGAAISWECRKQRTVALSSTEAEYMALFDSSKEAVHLRSFLQEILGQLKTTIIYNDNQGAGQLTRNPVFHKRTKHVDIRHHFIRELVEEGTISVNYIPTTEMSADILTKGLSASKHNTCKTALGMRLVDQRLTN